MDIILTRGKWARVFAALLTLVLMVTLCPLRACAEPLDLTKPNTITLNFDKVLNNDDLYETGLKVDLYRIATAVKDPAYESYGYSFESGFASAGLTIPSGYTDGQEWKHEQWKAAWDEFAGKAAYAALSATPTDSKALGEAPATTVSFTDLTSGLYLLLPHSEIENYANKDDTAKVVTDTRAQSPGWEYSFSPILISMPSKEADEDGVISTANPGDWLSELEYEIELEVKASMEPRFGDLVIEKTLKRWDLDEAASFVFQIEGEMGKKGTPSYKHYSNVVMITMSKAGTDSVTLHHLPVGMEVTVTEVYTGAKYKLTVDKDQTAVIKALNDPEAPATVHFENDYDDTGEGGHGILNEFESVQNEDGSYRWGWVKPDMNNG